MKRDNTPWRPVTAAEVAWAESGDPLSRQFHDVYYSVDNGLEESRYVFLQGNDLPHRCLAHGQPRFCVAETGFGTGLNFLLTWQAWRELPAGTPSLHYLSFEKYPLSAVDLAKALAAWPGLAPLAAELLDHYPGLLPGQHRIVLDGGRVLLDLWWEDVSQALPDLAGRDERLVDAWYLDGFAPARNESMWSSQLLHNVARLSRPLATFATFTAAGHVRRKLAEAGFDVSKAPGYGRKRECLRGTLAATVAADSTGPVTPWDLPHGPLPARPERVLVVGAGLAGCTLAAAVAARGIDVTVVDRAALAGAGSGNDQGILYTRLSRKHSALTDFALQSFHFATNYYRTLFASGRLVEGVDGSLCGNFQQSSDDQEMADMREVLAPVPELAQVLDRHQACHKLHIDQPAAGYWYPASGWLRPASICLALVADPRITLLENCGELRLEYDGDLWRTFAGNTILASAPCAVVAAGVHSPTLAPLAWLPVQAIRGQTTDLPGDGAWSSLRGNLCHEGYIAPARDGRHCIGATFVLHTSDTELREAEHASNLDKLARAVPAWRAALAALDPAGLSGRVGYRCASPDYLPIVGPVPDRDAFLHRYAGLRKNARQTISRKGDYMPGLYLSTAHGSRGLTSTPLAAELLASQICAEAPPMSRELCRALAPARFIIRDLARNRIRP